MVSTLIIMAEAHTRLVMGLDGRVVGDGFIFAIMKVLATQFFKWKGENTLPIKLGGTQDLSHFR